MRLQTNGCSKAGWKAGAVWPTTAYGCNLNSETTMRNETQQMAVILKTNTFAVFKYELRFFPVSYLLEK